MKAAQQLRTNLRQDARLHFYEDQGGTKPRLRNMMILQTIGANGPALSPAATARRPRLSPVYGGKASTLTQTELRQIVASVIG
jgi:hypothetical protein